MFYLFQLQREDLLDFPCDYFNVTSLHLLEKFLQFVLQQMMEQVITPTVPQVNMRVESLDLQGIIAPYIGYWLAKWVTGLSESVVSPSGSEDE